MAARSSRRRSAGSGGGGGGGGGGRRGGRRRGRGGRGGGQGNAGGNRPEEVSHAGQEDYGDGEAPPTEPLEGAGLLEVMQDGFGFLRFAKNNYLPDENDIYVPANLIRKFKIRPGAMIEGDVQPPRKAGQKPALATVTLIGGKDPELHADEVPFKNLLALDPEERMPMESPPNANTSMRVLDLLVPIGKGQRALIVAPPRTGKTILMQQMCNAIMENHPEMEVVVLLVDERPEEVTDFRRNTKAEVIASCLDEGTANHVKVTELVLDKMKRALEGGKDMVVFLDSITRVGRAYNNESKGSGRILSGGLDAKVLAKPKAFFGAARNIDEGGSLTIIATALIDTGSRLDQVIFEEFKGTGNSEVVLSRQLSNDRIWPAIDIAASGTRKEEKLFHPDEIERINVLRRVLNQLNPNEAMRLLVEKVENTGTNAEFLMQFSISASA